jgi:hypothetical protein
MARDDDDDYDNEERPRRRRDEDDEERAPRSRRPRDDDDDREERPRRSRRRDEDDDDLPPPRKKKSSLGLILGILGGVFLLCGGLCVGGWFLASSKIGDAKERLVSSNNMKQIGIGCHNYSSANAGFPTNSYTADGRPLLSWRVHILPYIGEGALYNKFKLDEAWDGPNNRRLLSEMPDTYATPKERDDHKWGTTTYYRGFSNPGTLFEKPLQFNTPPRGVAFNGVLDGMSNTILIVEAGEAVEWTKPDDLDASLNKPFPKLGGVRPKSDVILALMADGSVMPIKKSVAETMWRGATTYKGGEVVLLE